MSYIMTSAAFADTARRIATQYQTSYMLGPWGWPANDRMITRDCSGAHGAENKTWLSYANKIKDRGFLFDCVGLIKGILWGWSGDLSRTYGGAGYACNGVPDYDALGMINHCRDVSADFSSIVPGEAVYVPGHIGIYVGNGVVSEATPKWKWGVQLSTCLNVSKVQIPGTAGSRTWTKHGKLPWVDYAMKSKNTDIDSKEDDEMLTYGQWKEYMERYRVELGAQPTSGWAGKELAAAVAAGITDGKRPHDFVTREESAIMALRSKG